MKTEIYIATHKNFEFSEMKGYIPIHVGKVLTNLDFGMLGDDTGDNISKLNPNFCELTALYWMWKNSDADFLGLVHYRRFFSKNNNSLSIVNIDELQLDAKKNIVFLVKKEKVFIRKFRINFKSTVEKQYSYYHFSKDWVEVRRIVSEIYPDYIDSFDFVSKQSYISLYNMFIGSRFFLDEYCSWLFSILFALKDRIDILAYDSYQARVFGFLSERLLNVFLYKNKSKYNVEYLSKIMK